MRFSAYMLAAAMLLLLGWTAVDHAKPAGELSGLWYAKRSFGPELRGALTLERSGDKWRAHIAGHSTSTSAEAGEIDLEFPDGLGRFRGQIDPTARRIDGHWIQPPPVQVGGAMASPVRLHEIAPGRFRGEVTPRESEFTFYLKAWARKDGTVAAFLRNPDRNLGVFYNLQRIERDGNVLRFFGRFFRNPSERLLFEGTYYPDDDRFSIYIPNRGGTYDFVRADSRQSRGFYARSKTPAPFAYQPPKPEDDGWTTGTLEEVGMALDPLKEMVEREIDSPPADVHAHYVHGVLIARHGKLVFEEYFHGFHRDEPHDTRSASKSLTSLLVGAAQHAGANLDATTPIYPTLLGDALPAELDPRKLQMQLEHLLTMSSGFYCDDSDSNAPGNEDTMQSQTAEANWYRYTLGLPMADSPGQRAVYCSVNPNLIGHVLGTVTDERLEVLFERLIAQPLNIDKYFLFLQPTGEPYMGGGIHWLPRDFMKLGQVMLNGGTWNGHRIVDKQWAKRATSALRQLRDRGYGYQWWSMDYPYAGGQVQAFFAGGNGGQIVVGVPELDLLIAFFGGNYSDRVGFRSQNVLVPQYILRAVEQGAKLPGS